MAQQLLDIDPSSIACDMDELFDGVIFSFMLLFLLQGDDDGDDFDSSLPLP